MKRIFNRNGAESRTSMTGVVLLASAVLASAVVGCGGTAPEPKPTGGGHAHTEADPHAGHGEGGHETALMVSTVPSEPTAGEPTRLRLMIHAADGTMVKDFEITHEKKIHLIIVREDLGEFAHIHPEIDAAGNIEATFTFPTGGTYLVYADHKPAGQPQVTAKAKLDVQGQVPPAQQLSPNVPGEVSGDDLTATVSLQAAGEETEITFDLRDDAGQPVGDLEPYLGAMGHLVILSADGEEYVHSHPLEKEESPAGQVRFAAHFAGTGLYKGWGQFQRDGQVRTVPFVMDVK